MSSKIKKSYINDHTPLRWERWACKNSFTIASTIITTATIITIHTHMHMLIWIHTCILIIVFFVYWYALRLYYLWKIFLNVSFLEMYMKCTWHEMYMTWNVHDMKCTWHEMYMTWNAHDMKCTWHKMYMKCTWHEMYMTWNVHDMKCTWNVHDMKCTWHEMYMTWNVHDMKRKCTYILIIFLFLFPSDEAVEPVHQEGDVAESVTFEGHVSHHLWRHGVTTTTTTTLPNNLLLISDQHEYTIRNKGRNRKQKKSSTTNHHYGLKITASIIINWILVAKN